MDTSGTTTPPVRVGLVPDGRRSRDHLETRLGGFERRVQVLRAPDPGEVDLVLVDPGEDGASLDLVRLGDVASGRLVVFTSAPTVDVLAFAMAGSVMEGRLRGWLWCGLRAPDLVDALERIHRGDIVIQGTPG